MALSAFSLISAKAFGLVLPVLGEGLLDFALFLKRLLNLTNDLQLGQQRFGFLALERFEGLLIEQLTRQGIFTEQLPVYFVLQPFEVAFLGVLHLLKEADALLGAAFEIPRGGSLLLVRFPGGLCNSAGPRFLRLEQGILAVQNLVIAAFAGLRVGQLALFKQRRIDFSARAETVRPFLAHAGLATAWSAPANSKNLLFEKASGCGIAATKLVPRNVLRLFQQRLDLVRRRE